MTFQTLANVIIAEDRGDKKYSYLDLVRSSNMRKLALLTGITWWECFVWIIDFMMAENFDLLFKFNSEHPVY